MDALDIERSLYLIVSSSTQGQSFNPFLFTCITRHKFLCFSDRDPLINEVNEDNFVSLKGVVDGTVPSLFVYFSWVTSPLGGENLYDILQLFCNSSVSFGLFLMVYLMYKLSEKCNHTAN